MKSALMVSRGLLGLLGLAQLVLGIVLWTGHALSLVQLHMTIGFLFVLALWAVAILSARAGAPPALVAFAVAWGVLLPVFGMVQTRLLPGPGHWFIRVVHFGMGIVAMSFGGALTVRARAARPGPGNFPVARGLSDA